MSAYSSSLDWIDSQQMTMISRLKAWCEINTGSYNVNGLNKQCNQLMDTFNSLNMDVERKSLPPHQYMNDEGRIIEKEIGDLLLVSRRTESDRTVFLGGHMDTVFPADSSFQHVRWDGDDTLVGPGVTDDKGGLVVLLTAIECFENSPLSDSIGWEIFINPDEELGSPSSGERLKKRAKQHDFGLIFEPPLPDGRMVTERKGSGDFSVLIEGKSAHAGRNPDKGRDAVYQLANLIVELNELDEENEGLICNVGRINGGGPVNIVPDHALAHMNVRATTVSDQELFLD
ncbi:MAG: M20/M25/M40 family metallo-hydrolase, partial [bacterium]